MITKPDLNGRGLSHPARYSEPVLEAMRSFLPEDQYPLVLDPFGGTGLIAKLREPDYTDGVMEIVSGRLSVSVELEREWSGLTPEGAAAVQANALALPFQCCTFDAIATSPCFGNRLADKHNAKDGSVRRSYTHDLGHSLHPDNAGGLQWGEEYKEFHRAAWREAVRVLKPGGRFVIDIKNHIRKGEVQHVLEWHDDFFTELGLRPAGGQQVGVRHLRQGANPERCPEYVLAYDLS